VRIAVVARLYCCIHIQEKTTSLRPSIAAWMCCASETEMRNFNMAFIVINIDSGWLTSRV
jgi:hypothetical protein